MELDLLSLEGLAVSSSSRFCAVYGFSVSLGRRSGFGDVRHVYFHSLFKVALLTYFHCFQPPTYSWNHCGCFCSPFPPCTVGQSLLSRGFCGSFLGSPNLLCVAETCGLASLNTLSCPLHNSSCVHLSWLTGPPSMLQGLCVLLAPQAHPLCYKSFVCWRGLYDSHSRHSGPTLFFAGLLWAYLGSEPTI